MSTTPRTDAARGFHDMDTAVSAEDMAQLETELAAANECVAISNRSADDQMHQKREAQRALAATSLIAEKWEADALRYAKNAEYWQARAEKAEADTARLDWLGKASYAKFYEGPCVWRINGDEKTEGDTLRDAIDAAMKETSK